MNEHFANIRAAAPRALADGGCERMSPLRVALAREACLDGDQR